jgi:hypothetical protein
MIRSNHDLRLRMTHRYVGTFAHLDKIARGPVLGADPDEQDDVTEPRSHLVCVEVEAQAGISPESIEQALADSFTQMDCHHDYDCCGCRSYCGEATHIGSKIWHVTVSSSRNF